MTINFTIENIVITGHKNRDSNIWNMLVFNTTLPETTKKIELNDRELSLLISICIDPINNSNRNEYEWLKSWIKRIFPEELGIAKLLN